MIVLSSLNGELEVTTLEQPSEYKLNQNYPNLFNSSSTTIEYSIPAGKSVHVKLNVYDIRGALVWTIMNNVTGPGIHSVVWDGIDETGNRVSSGIYIYRLQAGKFTRTHYMTLVI